MTIHTAANSRITKLKEKMITQPAICVERGYFLTESYRQTEGDPAIVRRAKGLKNILDKMSIRIEDGELLVGWPTSKMRGGALLPEVQGDWILEEMETVSMRDWDKYAPLTEEEKERIKDFIPYWKGRSLFDKWESMIPDEQLRLNHKIQTSGGYCDNSHHMAHVAVDFPRLLAKGLNGIQKEIDQERLKMNIGLPGITEKIQFLTAASITIEGVKNFALRYAELAREMAGKEINAKRKTELEKIAATLDWVPANPARNFYEALQSIWLCYMVLMVEGWGAGMTIGRPDQYLYPFYKKDIEEGRLTMEEAFELIALLLIKMNGVINLANKIIALWLGGFPVMQGITVGGITPEGKDAVNELSYMFLDADQEIGLSSEDIVVRVNNANPEAFLIKACEVAKALKGKLKFVSDENIIQSMLNQGIPLEYARDYISTGCHNPTVPAHSHDTGAVSLNLPIMIELALNNGAMRLTGEQIGPKTGDPREFKSYDEVWQAYKIQVEAALPVTRLFRNVERRVYAEFSPYPFQSTLFNQSCIERGLDITNGGSEYRTHTIGTVGAPNAGDSLAAIKKVVFDDKKITMKELIDALDANFEGHEKTLHLLQSAPKFGNDDDYVDSITNDVVTHICNEITRYDGYGGAKSTASALAMTANIPFGTIIGALPDGRKAGEPLSEGGISPHQGRNISGPTATMRSVAKLDQIKLSHGSILNMRFNPDALKDAQKIKKFASLIRTFCETGGNLVQFNIVSSDTLRDAQKYPEKYRDLLVRVATYSAYFVELSPDLQNNIIERMEFQEV
jgi:choline trimethylamine-lyase